MINYFIVVSIPEDNAYTFEYLHLMETFTSIDEYETD